MFNVLEVCYIRDLHAFQSSDLHSVVIGNFDGLHLGHQVLIRTLVANTPIGVMPSCVIFYPHTRSKILHQDVKKLTSLRQKVKILSELGIGRLFILKFNDVLQATDPVVFVDALIKNVNITTFACCETFRFGVGRSGDALCAKSVCGANGVAFIEVGQLEKNGAKVAASSIKASLESGDIAVANAYLGREYEICGRVVHGEKNGRKIGFPTANICYQSSTYIPKKGVYGVRFFVLGEWYFGVCNIGKRPTISSDGKLTLEVHILDFDKDIYNEKVKVRFINFIREERKFASLDNLKHQIADDIANFELHPDFNS